MSLAHSCDGLVFKRLTEAVCSKTTKLEVLKCGLGNLEKTGVRVMVANFRLANLYPKIESQTER